MLYLVEGLAGHLDPIDLEDLVVDGEEPGALSQTTRHQPGDEYTRHLLQSLHTHRIQ